MTSSSLFAHLHGNKIYILCHLVNHAWNENNIQCDFYSWHNFTLTPDSKYIDIWPLTSVSRSWFKLCYWPLTSACQDHASCYWHMTSVSRSCSMLMAFDLSIIVMLRVTMDTSIWINSEVIVHSQKLSIHHDGMFHYKCR